MLEFIPASGIFHTAEKCSTKNIACLQVLFIYVFQISSLWQARKCPGVISFNDGSFSRQSGLT